MIDPGRGTDVIAEAVRCTRTYQRILSMVRSCAMPQIEGKPSDFTPENIAAVRRAREAFGVLSTGEQCAVALVLNRGDWLAERGWTLLDAATRIGEQWMAAATLVHRDFWDTSEKRWHEDGK